MIMLIVKSIRGWFNATCSSIVVTTHELIQVTISNTVYIQILRDVNSTNSMDATKKFVSKKHTVLEIFPNQSDS